MSPQSQPFLIPGLSSPVRKRGSVKFNYLTNYTFEVVAPQDILSRLPLHVESPERVEGKPDGRIDVVQAGSTPDFPPRDGVRYLELVPNHTRTCPGFDYIRYGANAKTIWRPSEHSYLIESRTRTDEMSVLDCMRDLWFSHPVSRTMALVHASCVLVGDRGLLIVGPCRSGKTTLAVRLLTELQGTAFVSEGLSLLSGGGGVLKTHYVTRAVYARFATFFVCNPLGEFFLSAHSRSDATQILDRDTIARIIRHRPASIDLGLNMARRRFCEALNVPSTPTATVSKIVFVSYSGGECNHVRELPDWEIRLGLMRNEFPKIGGFGRIERQREIAPPRTSQIQPAWLTGVRGVELSYDGWRGLSRTLLDDLVG